MLPNEQTSMWPQRCLLPWMSTNTPAAPTEQAAPSQTSTVARRRLLQWSPWRGAAPASPACLLLSNQVSKSPTIEQPPNLLLLKCSHSVFKNMYLHLQHCENVSLLLSVICPPMSVAGVTTCGNNDITVSWDPSPESGANYFIHSQEDNGTSANFSTSQTSHVLTGLQCGELYTLTVAASDNECSSVFSTPTQTETG